MSVFIFFILLLALALALGCAGTAAYDAHLENTADMRWVYNTAWGSAPHKYVTTKTGLRFRVLGWHGEDVPAEDIENGDRVVVLYKMFRRTHGDATTGVDWASRVHVYSQADMDNALVVTIGSGSVVAGVDEAIRILIRLGTPGIRGRFLLPSSIAFGASGAGGMDIPAHSEIEYFLEVVKRTKYSEL